jgi:MFS family permease
MQLRLSRLAASKERAALVACMLIPALSNGVFATSFPLWVVPWINEFRVPRSVVMTGFAIGNIVMGFASPIVGRTLERFPVRRSTALGGLALSGGFLLASVAPSIWQVIALYSTVMALGAAFTSTLIAQSVAIRILPHKAGTVSGLITLSMSGGSIVMPIILASLVSILGWRVAVLIAGVIILITIVPLSWFALAGSDAHLTTLKGKPAAIEAGAGLLTTRALLGSLAFWAPLMGIAPVSFVVGTVLTNSVAIAADSGIAIGVAGYLVPIIALGAALGSVSLGWLADRMDYRVVFAGTAAALVISLLLLLERVGLLPMAFAFAVVGFAAGGVLPLFGAVVARSFGPLRFPRVMGMMMPAYVLSMAIAPVFAGWVRDLTGSYGIAFAVCAGLMVLSGLVIVMIKASPLKPQLVAAQDPRV